jgi:hypothetical protein
MSVSRHPAITVLSDTAPRIRRPTRRKPKDRHRRLIPSADPATAWQPRSLTARRPRKTGTESLVRRSAGDAAQRPNRRAGQGADAPGSHVLPRPGELNRGRPGPGCLSARRGPGGSSPICAACTRKRWSSRRPRSAVAVSSSPAGRSTAPERRTRTGGHPRAPGRPGRGIGRTRSQGRTLPRRRCGPRRRLRRNEVDQGS